VFDLNQFIDLIFYTLTRKDKSMKNSESVLIVGAGIGLSASIARKCFQAGMKVNLAARDTKKIMDIAKETEAKVFSCDSSKIEEVAHLFEELDSNECSLDWVIYNPSARVTGPISDLDPFQTKKALEITCFGAFLVAKESTKRMLKQGHGSIFFTGASASVKGFANSSVFAMGKFGLRGLAQSLARELHPKNIHIGHFIIDGGIISSSINENDRMLDPGSIADTYLQFYRQHRSAWSWEVELRPWLEKF
jgi:short-subunit dehydrogenase